MAALQTSEVGKILVPFRENYRSSLLICIVCGKISILATSETNLNFTHNGNASYYSVTNCFSSRLLFKIEVLIRITTVTESSIIECTWLATCMRKTSNAYILLEGKCGGKIPIRGHKCWWEGKIKMDFKEIVCEARIEHMRLEIGTVTGSYEYGNIISGS
jgi:hypothetical protein